MATIREIIERVDDVKPNAFSQKTKVAWLAELDGRLAIDVFLMDISEAKQYRYTFADDYETELLVDFPHDGIYTAWLEAKIDLANGEYEKYQNSMEDYNAQYGVFLRWFAAVYSPAQGYGHRHCPPEQGNPPYYLTAYGLAVKRGYTGTLDQWLEELKAPAQLVSQSVRYQASTSGTEIPDGDWLDTIPTVADGEYLWCKTTLAFNTGEPVSFYTVSRMAADGEPGKDGEPGEDGADGDSTDPYTTLTYKRVRSLALSEENRMLKVAMHDLDDLDTETYTLCAYRRSNRTRNGWRPAERAGYKYLAGTSILGTVTNDDGTYEEQSTSFPSVPDWMPNDGELVHQWAVTGEDVKIDLAEWIKPMLKPHFEKYGTEASEFDWDRMRLIGTGKTSETLEFRFCLVRGSDGRVMPCRDTLRIGIRGLGYTSLYTTNVGFSRAFYVKIV